MISSLYPSCGLITIHRNYFFWCWQGSHTLDEVLLCYVCNCCWEGCWSARHCLNFETHIGSDGHAMLCTSFATIQNFFKCMISFVIVSYTLSTTSTLTLVLDYFDFLHYLCNQWSWSSLGLGKEIKIFDIVKNISNLLITRSTQYVESVAT